MIDRIFDTFLKSEQLLAVGFFVSIIRFIGMGFEACVTQGL